MTQSSVREANLLMGVSGMQSVRYAQGSQEHIHTCVRDSLVESFFQTAYLLVSQHLLVSQQRPLEMKI